MERETHEQKMARFRAFREGWSEGRAQGRKEMRKLIRRRLRRLAQDGGYTATTANALDDAAIIVTQSSRNEPHPPRLPAAIKAAVKAMGESDAP